MAVVGKWTWLSVAPDSYSTSPKGIFTGSSCGSHRCHSMSGSAARSRFFREPFKVGITAFHFGLARRKFDDYASPGHSIRLQSGLYVRYRTFRITAPDRPPRRRRHCITRLGLAGADDDQSHPDRERSAARPRRDLLLLGDFCFNVSNLEHTFLARIGWRLDENKKAPGNQNGAQNLQNSHFIPPGSLSWIAI